MLYTMGYAELSQVCTPGVTVLLIPGMTVLYTMGYAELSQVCASGVKWSSFGYDSIVHQGLRGALLDMYTRGHMELS